MLMCTTVFHPHFLWAVLCIHCKLESSKSPFVSQGRAFPLRSWVNAKAVHGGLKVGGGIACRLLQDRRVCPETDDWRQRRRAPIRPLNVSLMQSSGADRGPAERSGVPRRTPEKRWVRGAAAARRIGGKRVAASRRRARRSGVAAGGGGGGDKEARDSGSRRHGRWGVRGAPELGRENVGVRGDSGSRRHGGGCAGGVGGRVCWGDGKRWEGQRVAAEHAGSGRGRAENSGGAVGSAGGVGGTRWVCGRRGAWLGRGRGRRTVGVWWRERGHGVRGCVGTEDSGLWGSERGDVAWAVGVGGAATGWVGTGDSATGSSPRGTAARRAGDAAAEQRAGARRPTLAVAGACTKEVSDVEKDPRMVRERGVGVSVIEGAGRTRAAFVPAAKSLQAPTYLVLLKTTLSVRSNKRKGVKRRPTATAENVFRTFVLVKSKKI
ncbi:hypothetical protein K439DRAFT_1529203 [Ramaria rubella]|nr:hypothetical protein K439DRAFT_1529203 [Ramaria rubella]